MEKMLCFWVMVLACMTSLAQEPLMPLTSEKDSTLYEAERQIMYRRLLSGAFPEGNLTEPLQLQYFDPGNEMYKRWNPGMSDLTTIQGSVNGLMPGSMGFLSPFFRNETVLSSAVYRLNDRFSFGGQSFGANSLFTAPFPNQGTHGYDIRGSSLFLQYKVSGKFRIETRVNVIQSPGF